MAEEGEKTIADLGQFGASDDPKAQQNLLKSYKEIQAAFTTVSQENKTLKETAGNADEVQQLKADLESANEQLALRQPAPSPNQSKSFDEAWMDSPEDTIDDRVAQQVRLARIADVFDEENGNNPGEFQERVAYVNHLANDPKFVHLKQTPAGTRQLFKEADKVRKGNLENNLKKSLEFLNDGEPLDEEQLASAKKTLFGEKKTKTNKTDAYMPDGSTSTKSESETDQQKINNAEVNKAVDRGDVDGVLDGIFKDISLA